MVTSETLRQGAWYALEQAGRLLRAAVVLADYGDPISGTVLAIFGREELGRSRILRNRADRVDKGGSLEPDEVRKACYDHVKKQSRGAFITMLRAKPLSAVSRAMRQMLGAEPHSPQWKTAKQVVDSAMKDVRKRDPARRHRIRTASLYVDLDDAGAGWLKPCDRDTAEAWNEIMCAVNDYALECYLLRHEVLDDDYPEMARARTSMPSPITLPEPRWPKNSIREAD